MAKVSPGRVGHVILTSEVLRVAVDGVGGCFAKPHEARGSEGVRFVPIDHDEIGLEEHNNQQRRGESEPSSAMWADVPMEAKLRGVFHGHEGSGVFSGAAGAWDQLCYAQGVGG